MKNWKTTAAAVAALLVLVGSAARALLDGDPTTNVDLVTFIPAVIAAVGLIFAKDSNVTGGTVAATPEAAARIPPA